MPGDPGRAVRASPIVAEGELFDQDDGLAPPGQVIGGGRAHGPGPDDDVLDDSSRHRSRCSVGSGRSGQSAVR